jgi:hypothetical protein
VPLCAAVLFVTVTKRRGLVDDPTEDFNRVTSSIKEDISSLNNKLNEIEVQAFARRLLSMRQGRL